MKSQFCPCLLFPAQSDRVFAPRLHREVEKRERDSEGGGTIRIRSSLRRLAERRKPWRFQVGKAFAVFVLGGRRPQLRLFRDSREGGRP
ncbi:hypothetical protein RchiOBHm_Chr1g0315181 [Rosa chinensis]|uniref:Uncharacterized protein n=1 Tax=Rosa chinensis TaxID=74649 RepID=A0A2P6S7A2_ROSCH|nr:hypothetical protein RchiOBHm_Chr1g0315181 [Rosa chinensis]